MNAKICFCLLVCCLFAACSTFYVGPRYEYMTADVEVEVMDVSTESEFEFNAIGFEVVGSHSEDDKAELFFDLSTAEVEDDDTDWEGDGYEFGFGIRSRLPTEEGLSLDCSFRISRLSVEDDLPWGGTEDIIIWGIDGHVGPAYSVLTDDRVVSVHGGLLGKLRSGGEDLNNRPNIHFESEHIGVYAGISGNNQDGKGVLFRGDLFVGTDNLAGFLASIGFSY